MNILLLPLIIFLSIFGEISAYAEKSYHFEIDEHVYDLEYNVDANVLEMALDQELNSFLIGIENTHDSLFSIILPNEMISAENNEFAVLVNGLEVDYTLESTPSSSKISFFVFEGTQEIEIIGTHVIPEFPFSVFALILLMTSAVILTKRTHLFIK
jgi:hypothetical protein